jgi:DNA-binding GntR family transcriptional regulator
VVESRVIAIVEPQDPYERLRDLIVRGRLAPGGRLIETDVARRLGVSRTPVREALRRLQQEGYVRAEPGGQQARLSVTPLTRADAEELLTIVGALEGLAAAQASRLPKRERTILARELTRLNASFGASAGPDLDGLYRHDEEFHRRYVVAGGGGRLIAMHDAIKPQAERYIRMYIGLLANDVSASVTEHAAVITAIATAKPKAAERAVRANWRHATDRIARVIDLAGELGQA